MNRVELSQGKDQQLCNRISASTGVIQRLTIYTGKLRTYTKLTHHHSSLIYKRSILPSGHILLDVGKFPPREHGL